MGILQKYNQKSPKWNSPFIFLKSENFLLNKILIWKFHWNIYLYFSNAALIKRQMMSGSVKIHLFDNANASTLTTPLKFTTIGWKKPIDCLTNIYGEGFSNDPLFYWNGKFNFYYCDKEAQIYNTGKFIYIFCTLLALINNILKFW